MSARQGAELMIGLGLLGVVQFGSLLLVAHLAKSGLDVLSASRRRRVDQWSRRAVPAVGICIALALAGVIWHQIATP
jgi:hypothetical protein